MISLWPHWQRPLFLILLPIFIYLLWKMWKIHEVKGSWLKLIPSLFQPWLLKGVSAEESSIPKLIMTSASLFAFLALLGPSWQHIEQPPLKVDSPLVIVLDMTPRMLSNDIQPSRLESVVHKITDILKARKDAQTAIVVYSGSAHTVVPLSDDQATIGNLLQSMSPSIMPKVGERADLGVAKAIQLINNTKQNTQINHADILLITTDLSDQEQAAINSLLKDHIYNLHILGVGTAQGGPILDANGSFLRDNSGNVMLTKLNSKALQQFAYNQGGYYSSITLDDSDIKALNLTQLGTEHRASDNLESKTTNIWQDQGYWLLLPLLLLAALAGRRGWLACIPFLIVFQPQSAQAFEWNQIWLNKNQQAEKLLQDNKPVEAAKLFQDKQWQGYSLYQAKNYKQAEQHFAKETTPEGIYNYGNTLARQGKYQEAIEQWDKAIKAKPNFEQAIVNKKIVEDLLKKQQQSQQSKDNKQQPKQDNKQENQQQQDQSDNDQQQNDQQQNNQQDKEQSQKEGQNQQQSDSKQQQDQDDQQQDKQQSDQAKKEQEQSEQSQQQGKQEKQQAQQESKEQSQQATEHSAKEAEQDLEQREANELLQQKIRDIPDDPSELLRRKFYYEQRYNRGDD